MVESTVTPDEITIYDDHIDSRDVQTRAEWLVEQIKRDTNNDLPWNESDHEELELLEKLKKDYIEYYGESSWEFGAQFIRDSYLEDYAQELGESCGLVQDGARWIDFGGIPYQTQEA